MLTELSPGFASDSNSLATAEFVAGPAIKGVTMTANVALACAASEPSEKVTVPEPCVKLPWETAAEKKLTLEDSVVTKFTLVAAASLALVRTNRFDSNSPTL